MKQAMKSVWRAIGPAGQGAFWGITIAFALVPLLKLMSLWCDFLGLFAK